MTPLPAPTRTLSPSPPLPPSVGSTHPGASMERQTVRAASRTARRLTRAGTGIRLSFPRPHSSSSLLDPLKSESTVRKRTYAGSRVGLLWVRVQGEG